MVDASYKRVAILLTFFFPIYFVQGNKFGAYILICHCKRGCTKPESSSGSEFTAKIASGIANKVAAAALVRAKTKDKGLVIRTTGPEAGPAF
jgi:hypothetical protein